MCFVRRRLLSVHVVSEIAGTSSAAIRVLIGEGMAGGELEAMTLGRGLTLGTRLGK